MTSWVLSLWPTAIPASDPAYDLLHYQWSICTSPTVTSVTDLASVSVLPPVLIKDDTLRVLLHSSNGTHSISADSSIVLSHEVTAPSGFPSGDATPVPGDQTYRWPPSGDYKLPAPTQPPFQVFKFRLTITCTPVTGSPTIYTVDPEMIVGDGQGTGAPPGTS